MGPDQRRSLVTFLFALPIIAMIMVMVFGGSTDPTAKWLEKWSTLIAGLLAVGAAVATVRQMQNSDARQHERFERSEALQQRRHEELIDLTLRADRLRVLRAAKPHANNLRDWADAMNKLATRFDQELGGGDDLPSIELLEELGTRIFHCGYILDDRAVAGAEDLFGPGLVQKYDEAIRYTARLEQQKPSVEIALFGLPGHAEFVFDRPRALELVRQALMTVRPLIPVAHLIASSLNRLALEYEGLAPLD